ncbi:COG3650 family protein [Pseudogemmobacter bohemicus]|uniref:COG3650 family protein n=1 Tax=Pseudogemmobacter bohemicus TaxID=2250708 RepID=UPI0013008EE3|nr:SH3 domain-containing protein [Pseudogemmobacter bohemicus]
MIRLLFCILALASLPLGPGLRAETLPSAWRVEGVSAGDVLNIRAGPTASSGILGTIPRDSSRVEVLMLSEDGKWGLVGFPEGNGWVAMRYLAPVPPPPAGEMPRPMRCLGTEPFWSLSREAQGGTWSVPEEPGQKIAFLQAYAAPGGYYAQAEDRDGRMLHLIVTREVCTDGMSDRIYGFSARLFAQHRDGNRLYSGCCTLDGR